MCYVKLNFMALLFNNVELELIFYSGGYTYCWWYHQYVTVHHVPKCMSYPKAIVVITGREHCFHDCICITPILLRLFSQKGPISKSLFLPKKLKNIG